MQKYLIELEPEIEVLLVRLFCGYLKKDFNECNYYDGLLGDAFEELNNFLKEQGIK